MRAVHNVIEPLIETSRINRENRKNLRSISTLCPPVWLRALDLESLTTPERLLSAGTGKPGVSVDDISPGPCSNSPLQGSRKPRSKPFEQSCGVTLNKKPADGKLHRPTFGHHIVRLSSLVANPNSKSLSDKSTGM
jgi:hypothetical protein